MKNLPIIDFDTLVKNLIKARKALTHGENPDVSKLYHIGRKDRATHLDTDQFLTIDIIKYDNISPENAILKIMFLYGVEIGRQDWLRSIEQSIYDLAKKMLKSGNISGGIRLLECCIEGKEIQFTDQELATLQKLE